MKGSATVAAALVLLTTAPLLPALRLPARGRWEQADRATVRLGPEEFPELPRSIQSELRRRGCSIPQPFTNGRRQNVIRGSFIRSGQVDWAALCSRQRASAILVFVNSDPRLVEELASRLDADYLQAIDTTRIGYSRTISVALVEYIRQHRERYGGPKLPQLTHAGINDAFVEKASVVWYWHRGSWLQLTGAN
jgi:hypothetical protein